uniref:N-acetyltransferase domain-containing protein n=1 Tax=Plectus sambesii TaxID=2011161 RepID=A0A914XM82_9BILA
MSEPRNGATIFFLDPPTEEQWSQIQGVVDQVEWDVSHWNYFLILSRLPYAKAVVSVDDKGKYVGILVFAQPPSPHVSYVGLYIVSESCRGNGIGQRMWKLMKEHTDESRVLAIDSEGNMTDKYRAVEFPVPGPTWQEMSGPVAQLNASLQQAIQEKDCRFKIIDPNTVMDEVIKFDSKIMHLERPEFVQQFFRVADGKAIIAEDGSVVAIGATMPTFLHEKQIRIGPLYAENFNCMLMLLSALMHDVKQPEFLIMAPSETEKGRMFIDFLTEKSHSSLGSLFMRSFDRPYECPTEWSKVFALSFHVASPTMS